MNIFYETSGNAKNKKDFDPFLIRKMNPNSAWANHSYNHFVLRHIFGNSPDPLEKIQAGKEIEIAERKMSFWERHNEFHLESALYYRQKYYRM
jgi:hypothetical protein